MVAHAQINIKRTKVKNYNNILIDTEKAFNKIQYHFMINILKELGIKVNYLNIIKITYVKPHS